MQQIIDIAFNIKDDKAGNVNGSNLREKLVCALVVSIYSQVYYYSKSVQY